MSEHYFVKKGPTGCLLLHGFTASHTEVIALGKFLAEHNLTFSIPTLPGHGTHSADLFNYTWRDWFECVKQAHARLAAECEEVFVCGMSMGGTLALHLAAHRPVRGVVSLAAPIHYPNWQVRAVRLIKSVKRFRVKRGGEDVHDLSAKAELGSYRRYPYYAVDQLFQLLTHMRTDLPEIVQPLLIMHSRNDHTVDFENAQIIYDEVSSQDKRLVELTESYHIITVDYDRDKVQNELLGFIETHSKLFGDKKK